MTSIPYRIVTGEPGTYLIDLYPAIYKSKNRVLSNYQTPFLTYAQDFPVLSIRLSLAELPLGDRSDAVDSFNRPRQDTILPTLLIYVSADLAAFTFRQFDDRNY